MEVSKQLIIGLLIGVLIGAAVVFALSQFSDLQTQIRDLQSQVSQLQEENNQLRNATPSPSPSPTSTPTPSTSPSPSPSPSPTSSPTPSSTLFEKVEFLTAYASSNSTYFKITLNLKNTGSVAATINPDLILYNGIPGTVYTGHVPVCNFTSNIVMTPGQTASAIICLDKSTGTPWVAGMTVEITLHTTSGKDYPRAIVLP